jgi:hypothetical protein
VPFPDLTVILKRDLDPAGKCLEVLADLGRPGCIQLVNTCVLELQLQPHPVVRIPAECCAEDLLVVAIDTAGDALRHAGNDVAVLVCDAPAGGEFPCADAALIEGKRVIDLGPGERGIPSTERIDSPVMTQPAST